MDDVDDMDELHRQHHITADGPSDVLRLSDDWSEDQVYNRTEEKHLTSSRADSQNSTDIGETLGILAMARSSLARPKEALSHSVTSIVQLSEATMHSLLARVTSKIKDDNGSALDIAFQVIVVVGIICALLFFFRKSLSKIEFREYFGIGVLLRKIGYDKHEGFNVSILIDTVEYSGQMRMALKVTCGKEVQKTAFWKKGTNQVHQTLQMKIPQGSTDVVFSAVGDARGTVASKTLTTEKLKKLATSHKQTVLTLARGGKEAKDLSSDIKVHLTLVLHAGEDGTIADLAEADGIDTSNVSPEMQMLLQQSRSRSGNVRDASDSEDDGTRSTSKPLNQLELLAAACQGSVTKSTSLGYVENHYISVYKGDKEGNPHEFAHGSKADILAWHFGWWNDEMSCKKKASPVGSIPMLRIANVYVLPEKEKKDHFALRYVNKLKVKEDMVFQTRDRSREVWVECLHIFLERLWKFRKELAASKGKKNTGNSRALHSTSGRIDDAEDVDDDGESSVCSSMTVSSVMSSYPSKSMQRAA